MPDPEVSIIVPAYNEEAAIAGVLAGIRTTMASQHRPWELVVVDDGSTDRTAEIAASFADARLVQHRRNRGAGAAVMAGIVAARAAEVVIVDADGTYPIERIPALIDALDTCDMAVGCRTREAGSWPWLRAPAKAAIRLLASYLVGERIPDLNSGLRAFRKDLALRYRHILPKGHSWVSTITLASLSGGLAVEYLPIEYYPRQGQSTFHPLGDTYNYLLLVARTIVYFNPLKIFIPAGGMLLLSGALKLPYDLVTYHFHISPSTILMLLSGLNILLLGFLADAISRLIVHRP